MSTDIPREDIVAAEPAADDHTVVVHNNTITTFNSTPSYVLRTYSEVKLDRTVTFRGHQLHIEYLKGSYENTWMNETELRILLTAEDTDGKPQAELFFWDYMHDYHQNVDPELTVDYDDGFPIKRLQLQDWYNLCGQKLGENIDYHWRKEGGG